jgi:DNA-binding CsgD family transcriptional regulator/tetratricopeptide (TPR) repeat protein
MEVVPNDLNHVDILARAAQAAGLLGEDAAALRLVGDALAAATQDRERAELLVMLGSIHYAAGRGIAAEAVLREALDLIPPEDASVLAARAHLGLGRLAAAWSRAKEAEAETALALELSVSLGARREEGRTRNAIGVLASLRGAIDDAVYELRTALDIAAEIGDAEDLASAYINLSHVLGVGGRLPEQIDVCRAGVEALTRMGLLRQGGSLLMANAGESLIKLGRLAEADALLARAHALHPRGIMAAPVLLRSSQLAVVRGELTRAREHCAQAQAIVEAENAPSAWFREVAEVAAETELWAGHPDAAYRLVIEALHVIEGTDEEVGGTLLVALGLRAIGDQRETHRDPDSRVRLKDQCTRLLESGAAAEWRPDRPDPVGSAQSAALYATARAELARAEDLGDIACWASARRRWSELERPFAAGYAQWREAEARLRAGVDADGIAALRGAYAIARRLGAQRLMAELRALARWYRVDLVEEVIPPGPDGLARYGLTAREREVLAGLAAGRTNQEIADQLFISVKTASVHVSNILRKFDVPHRQDAARIAHRHGVRN